MKRTRFSGEKGRGFEKRRKIDYISLGRIKLNKLLIDAIKERAPGSPIFLSELVPSVDGKIQVSAIPEG